MTYGELWLVALTAHFIADYPLQGEFLATMKGKYDYLLAVHVFIWSGCVCGVLIYADQFQWWKLAVLYIPHFFIDRWKARKVDKSKSLTSDLFIDQWLHFIQVTIVVFLKYKPT